MANLAIQGHSTRGSEVIALLEMLGGINTHNLYGDESYAYYTIDSDKEIKGGIYVFGDEQLCHFTLERFEEKFPYKVGDKVTLDKFLCEIKGMSWEYDDIIYYVKGVDFSKGAYSKDLQPYKEETMKTITIDDFKANTKEWLIDKLHGMIISDAIKTIGNIHDELHKPKYPKTYKECCDVLGLNTMANDAQGYEADLIIRFQELLIAREAYWKIAGEQMGLGKPWKPDWNNVCDKYTIYTVYGNEIWRDTGQTINTLLAFPTKEMRDAFYENFKELIEVCKELL